MTASNAATTHRREQGTHRLLPERVQEEVLIVRLVRVRRVPVHQKKLQMKQLVVCLVPERETQEKEREEGSEREKKERQCEPQNLLT